jgi:protein TonB
VFQQFSGQDSSRASGRLIAALGVALFCYGLLGVGVAKVLSSYALEKVADKELEVTFHKALPPPPPPPNTPPPPPPPPPPPTPRPKLPPPKFLPPKPLLAPTDVPEADPQEADPSQERGQPEGGGDGNYDPASLPGGPVAVVEAPPPPPPPPVAVVLPPGATPAKRLNPEVTPDYPRGPREAGIEGEVIVKLIVHTDGHAELVKIVRSDSNFDEAVRVFIPKLRYSPAVYEGRALAVFVNMRIPFKLRAD